MKILLAFDSFKGSLSSTQAGEIVAEVLSAYDTEVLTVADGGEGSLQVLPYPSRPFAAVDPLGNPLTAHFKYHKETAYFELALTCGLTLVKEKNPLKAHTEGLGMGIREAINLGYSDILLFAGGSATHDAGLGALYALGFRFFNSEGLSVRPRGENLSQICRYLAPALPEELRIRIATDVNNPFTGPEGAAAVYAPQKGAKPQDLPLLEAGLVHLEKTFAVAPLPPGSGAAGGLAGGFKLFLNAEILSASEVLLKGVKEKVQAADLVITGEGRVDGQTLSGKLISKLLEMSTEKKFIVVAGRIVTPLTAPQILRQKALADPAMSTPYAMKNAAALLRKQAQLLLEFLENYANSKNINA